MRQITGRKRLTVERWMTQTCPHLNERGVRPDHTRSHQSARWFIHSDPFIHERHIHSENSVFYETYTFVTVFTKPSSGPHPEPEEPSPPPCDLKWPLAFKHPRKIFYAFFSSPIHGTWSKLVHRPPHDHCNTAVILGVGTSNEAIHCVIFLLRLKRNAAITKKQYHSGQRMSYTYTRVNKNPSAWNFLSPKPEVTCGTVAIIIRVVLLSPYLRIPAVSLSSIHYNQSHRVYINRRRQYICLIWN